MQEEHVPAITKIHLGVCAECGTVDIGSSVNTAPAKRYPERETARTGKVFQSICNACYDRLLKIELLSVE